MKTNDPVVASLIGQVVAERYRVDALIDQGAMGQVFLAEHILMRKRVALKVLRPELTRVPEVLARFEREAMAAANISHPNVVAATDFGRLPSGAVFLVLEFVAGRTLRSVLAEGPMEGGRALVVAEQIASALQAAHALSIVHRDLKPENVMLGKRPDGSDWVKVLDFGVAKVPLDIGESSTSQLGVAPLTKAGMIFGTPDYMSPEQALGLEADPRADLFSLGIILYELLAGVRPFQTTDELGVLGQQLSEGMPPLAVRAPEVQVPAVVEEFVAALLVTDINARVQTAGEAITRLRLLIESGVARRSPHSDAPPRGLPAIPRTPQRASQTSPQAFLTRTFSGLPEPLNLLPIWVFAAVMSVFVLGVSGLMWAVLHPPADVVPNTPLAETPTVPTGLVARPSSDGQGAALASPEQLADAVKSGTPAITALSERFPRDGQVHLALARALLKDGDRVAAVSSVRKAVEADPGLSSDRYVAGVLWYAVQRPTSSDAAFDLIKGSMRAAGADIAFDLAVTSGVPANVTARARAWLKTKGFERASTPEASIAAGLLLAPSCKARQALVKRAENVGDARSIPLLKQFQDGTGCASDEAPDCNACLKGSPAVSAAIETIRARNTQVRPPIR